ncbi:MAG: hypothetical protein KBH29_06525 [Lutibacter sp.]|nr:hypothetical protein [Lutibacter sp.]
MLYNFIKIKTKLKHSISFILVLTVLLPFAVQFVHSFEKHEHTCTAQNKIHFDTHTLTDCSVFHFSINTLKIDFNSATTTPEIIESKELIPFTEAQTHTVNLHYKSSRAPPILLV